MHTSPRLRSLLEAAGILLLKGVFAPLPPRAASALGAALGGFLFSVVRLERRTTLANLELALGPAVDRAGRVRLAARCYRHFGALIGEFLCQPRLAGRALERHIELENPQVLDAALAQGKGLLLVSGHLGNWELLMAAVAARNQPFTAYVGQQHNPLADAAVNAIRRRVRIGTVGKQAGMRGMLRALKGGGILAMATDQHFSRNRHFVRFFGRPVSAAPGMAALMQHGGLPGVYAETWRVGRFRYRARFVPLPVPPPSGDAELDLLRITQGFFDLLEAAVRRHPEQYFWMHKRWRPAPGEEQLSAANRRFLAGAADPAPGAADGPGAGGAGVVGRRPPIFLDRDGTLIEEVCFLSRLEQMRLLPGAAQAVRRANEAGHPVVVVTNQSGVARGLFSEAFVHESEAHLRALLAAQGARLDGHYYCPYHPQGRPPYDRTHPDRKPGSGMLLRAAQELNLSLQHLQGAWMIGDKRSDLETGAGLGVIPVLVRTGFGRETEAALPPDFQRRGGRVFDDVAAAIAWVLAQP
jgi:D-glycero-D-manno-heptose 1,7-bisphosphate phosphatase